MPQCLFSKNSVQKREAAASFPIWDCGSLLYDSYELVSITSLIDRHMMALPLLAGSEPIVTKFYHPQEVKSMFARRCRGSSMAAGSFGVKRKVVGEKKYKYSKKMKSGFSGFCIGVGMKRQ